MALVKDLEHPKGLPEVPRRKIESNLKKHWKESRSLRSTCKTLHHEVSVGEDVPKGYKTKVGFLVDLVSGEMPRKSTSVLSSFTDQYILETKWFAHYTNTHDPLKLLTFDTMVKCPINAVVAAFCISSRKDGHIEKIIFIPSDISRPSFGGSEEAKKRVAVNVVLQNQRKFDCSDFLFQQVETVKKFYIQTEDYTADVLEFEYKSGEKLYFAFSPSSPVLSPMGSVDIGPETEFHLETDDVTMMSIEDICLEQIERVVSRRDKVQSIVTNQPTTSETGIWKHVPDLRRLLVIDTADRNPRPAPGGKNHPARNHSELPGMTMRLFDQARCFSDYLYDDRVVHQSNNEFISIPVLAIKHGTSERFQKQLMDAEMRRIDAHNKRERYELRQTLGRNADRAARNQLYESHGVLRRPKPDVVKARLPQITQPNARHLTLLLRYSQDHHLSLTPLPCHLKDDELTNPTNYYRPLLSLTNGWHCWPEEWTRLMMDQMTNNKFITGDTLAEFSALLLTDVPIYRKAAGKILEKVSKVAQTKVFTNEGGKGYRMGVHDKGALHLTIGENVHLLGFANLVQILDKVLKEFPKWMEIHTFTKQSGYKGVHGVCIRIRFNSLALFLEGNDGKRLATALNEWGKVGNQVMALFEPKAKEPPPVPPASSTSSKSVEVETKKPKEQLDIYLRAFKSEDIEKLMNILCAVLQIERSV